MRLLFLVFLVIPRFEGVGLGERAPGPLSLSISSSNQSPKPTSANGVKITLTNTSDQGVSIKLSRGQPELMYAISLHDEAGKALPMTPYYRRIRLGNKEPALDATPMFYSILIRTLKPGEKSEEEFDLERLFEINRPGRYTVQLEKTDAITKTV